MINHSVHLYAYRYTPSCSTSPGLSDRADMFACVTTDNHIHCTSLRDTLTSLSHWLSLPAATAELNITLSLKAKAGSVSHGLGNGSLCHEFPGLSGVQISTCGCFEK